MNNEKRFSFVRECDGFLQCFETLGPQPRMSNELDGFCLRPLQLNEETSSRYNVSERRVFLRLAISFRLAGFQISHGLLTELF